MPFLSQPQRLGVSFLCQPSFCPDDAFGFRANAPKQGSSVSYSATTPTVSNDMTFPCARFALIAQLFDFFIG